MVRMLKGLTSFSVLFMLILIFTACQKDRQASTTTASADGAATKELASRRDATGISFLEFKIKGSELGLLNVNDFLTLSLTDSALFKNLYGSEMTNDTFADFQARLNPEFSGKASHPQVEVVFYNDEVEINEVTINAGLANEYKLVTVENILPQTIVSFNMNQNQFSGTQGEMKYLSFRGYQLEAIDETHYNLVPVHYLFATRNERFLPEYNANFERATFNSQYFTVSKQASK